MIQFTVPGEPVAKGRPRMTRSGHAFTPAKTVNYETLIKECFAIAYPEHVPTEKAVSVQIEAFFGIPSSWSKKKQAEAYMDKIRPTKRPDLTNIIKSVEDALNQLAYKDDSQIVTLITNKYYSDRPRVDVSIVEI